MKLDLKLIRRGLLLLALTVSLMLPSVIPRQSAVACWIPVLTECFDRPFNDFPWENPVSSGRWWRVTPSFDPWPRWGIQEVVYSIDLETLCSGDIQSLWCMGGTGTYDPDFDTYTNNLGTYVIYGPFDLSEAVDAVVQFQFLCESEMFGDSIFWGASTTPTLNMDSIYIDSSFSGSTIDQFGTAWKWWTTDLGDLHTINGDPVSMIGQSQVYAFWWFDADGDAFVDQGAFIDNVLIQWDNGMIDVSAGAVTTTHIDSTNLSEDPVVGDEIRQRIVWKTCAGGTEEYPPVRITVNLLDPLGFETILLDTTVEEVTTDTSFTWFTAPWTIELDGTHIINFDVDPENEIEESQENNNSSSTTFWAWPPNPHPEFTWLQPAEDTLVAWSSVVLRWEAYDLGETAVITIKSDDNNEGCFGQAIPGGSNIDEIDGEDSLTWDISFMFPGHTRWVWARIADSQWDTCIYAPYPILRDTTEALNPAGAVPSEFFLSQNYPNPFNPATEIRFGVTQSGSVSLRVFDLLGRDVAMLVDENLTPGTYTRNFSGRELPSGVYLYQLSSPEGIVTQKMVLLK